jgi:hypothetical protein
MMANIMMENMPQEKKPVNQSRKNWRNKIFTIVASAMLLANPVFAMADDTPPYDGRLQVLSPGKAELSQTGTSLTYLLFLGLGLACLGGLFKHANRSHLD